MPCTQNSVNLHVLVISDLVSRVFNDSVIEPLEVPCGVLQLAYNVLGAVHMVGVQHVAVLLSSHCSASSPCSTSVHVAGICCDGTSNVAGKQAADLVKASS
jgi:hypothetical protein